VFQHELAQSLAVADQVVLADVFKSEAIPENERLDPVGVVADINNNGKPARLLRDADAIVEAIAAELRNGDVVVILSNGGFGGIYEKLPAKLKSIHEVTTTA
jgi:UDP-N-acetylmuramate: L-alanyl-gamma-D-glutamyl-meso-diaminopimelate ligase